MPMHYTALYTHNKSVKRLVRQCSCASKCKMHCTDFCMTFHRVGSDGSRTFPPGTFPPDFSLLLCFVSANACQCGSFQHYARHALQCSHCKFTGKSFILGCICKFLFKMLYCIVFKYLYSAPQQPWGNRGAFDSISSKKRQVLRSDKDVERLDDKREVISFPLQLPI